MGNAGEVTLDPAILNIDAAAATTIVSSLASGGTVYVEADDQINVNAEINSSAQTIAGTLNFRDENGSDVVITLNADITLGATQDLIFDGVVVLGVDTVLLTAANITTNDHVFGATDGVGNLTITTAGTAQLNGRFGWDPTLVTNRRLATLTINGGGVTNFNGGGNATFNPNIATTGLQQYDNDSFLQANSAFGSDHSDIIFGNIDGGRNLIVSPLFGSVTFNGTIGATTPLISIQALNASVITFNTTTVTTTDLQRYFSNSPVEVNPAGAGTITFTSNTSFVKFDRTLRGVNDGEDNVIISTNTNAIFNRAVGDNNQRLNNLTVTGATAINGGSVTTLGNQTYNNTITLGANTVFTGNDGTFTSGSDGNGNDLTLNFVAETILDNTTFAFTNINNLTTGGGGNTRINGDFTTTGTQTYNDTVTLNSDATLAGTAVAFNGTVDNATATARNLPLIQPDPAPRPSTATLGTGVMADWLRLRPMLMVRQPLATEPRSRPQA